VIWISSPSFHYDYLDRRAAKSKKNIRPLPNKIGSFQVFLNEYKDANIFLREHPWPENHSNNTATTTVTNVIGHETKNRRLNALMCGRSGIDDDNGETPESYQLGRRFVWTPELQLQFREQFEKLVILDYLMRNTGNIYIYSFSFS
jgi:phosphatidylinositol 4-kinase type 2